MQRQSLFEKDQTITTLQLQIDRINALADQKKTLLSVEIQSLLEKFDSAQDERNEIEQRFFEYRRQKEEELNEMRNYYEQRLKLQSEQAGMTDFQKTL